ncbi:major yolk protein-like [Apostichopus japonicus]|uniref:major yolk protein-like n=1 Tax=Stichopus japonicus TaxID=307972 RepID=UPI003AB4A061
MKYLLLLSVIGLAFAGPTPVTKDVVTAGTCPVDHVFPTRGMCEPDCLDDRYCQEGLKCCMTANCGLKCLAPVVQNSPENITKTKQEITELLTTILEERQDLIEKLEKFPPPMLRFIAMKNRTDVMRMCVTSPCELRKCQRLATELTYNVVPRKEHFCQVATSTKQCLFWVERGWADLVVARDLDIYHAKTKFNVTAFAQETLKNENLALIEKVSQNITLAVTMRQSHIHTLNQLEGAPICSAGINNTASFISPVATLISKGIIPITGSVLESAADFFGDMCVPGALNKTTVNTNETLPEKFLTGCNQRVDEFTGIVGSLRCVSSVNGVAFVDHKIVKEMMENTEYNDNFRLVCEGENKPLSSWVEKPCQIGYTPRPILFVNPERNTTYIQELTTIMTNVVKKNTGKVGSLNIFNSTEIVCGNEPNKNLIFMDENNAFTAINESIAEQMIETKSYFRTYNICESLVPKPTVRFCVTKPVEYNKCLTMKHVFEKHEKLSHIAWGCVHAPTSMECMRNVLNGTAEIFSGNVEEIFIGGRDFLLQPIMMQDPVMRESINDYVNKVFGTHSVSVMKKSKLWNKFGQDTKFLNIRNLTVCSAGINKVESFHLPVGRMLSTNVMPRIGSVFESVNRFFKSACIPGATPVSYKHDLDLVIGHELNWGIPGLSFYNFTGFDWFIWNAPHTWTFYNYNRKTPGTLQRFMKNRLLVPLLEGKLSLPDEFDPNTFDYSILDDVLSVEGLGDILSDIPDKIRDRLVDMRVSNKDKMSTFKDLYEDRTGTEFVRPKDKRLSKQTLRSYLQQSFTNMQDEWGIFENVNNPVMTPNKPVKSMTGGKVTNVRRFFDEHVKETDPNTIIGNLLMDYDSEYTVPLITKIFAKVLNQRFDTLFGLADSLSILHGVPTMSSVHDEQYEWIKHPAVQAFVRIYAPRLATYYSDLYTNSELNSMVHSRYHNPLWLTPTYPEFLDTMKTHMTDLIHICQGFGEHKGELSDEEPFYGLAGSIECIADGSEGDIAFVELESLVKELPKMGQSILDYVIVTPLGLVKEVTPEMITNITFLRNVTFGVKAFPALLTSFNKTGSWRWNVTKALLDAQKIFSDAQNNEDQYHIFGSASIFAPETVKLAPIPIQDQTYATYLGPNLTRSFEAIIKPSTFDWWKERRHICTGESYTNVIEQRNGTCKAIVKDVTCGGMPRPKVISVGTTENKKPVVVRMCSRPTSFVREMAEFVCDNGHGYVSPVMVPTTCSCVPCEDIEYIPDWTNDTVWNSTTLNHTITEHFETLMPLWGNKAFWMNHTLNSNFMIGVPKNVTHKDTTTLLGDVNIKPLDTCEANWYGFEWHKEWFPESNRPVCLGTVNGLRRVLTSERVQTKIMP